MNIIHIGFVEHCFPEFKMQQSIERNCFSGNQTLKKKLEFKANTYEQKQCFSTHKLEMNQFYFKLLARNALPIYHLHFPNNL